MRILITGGSGKLGTALKKVFKKGLFPTKSELDITNNLNVKKYFDKMSPDIIIHTAAIANVKLCEADKKLAWNTNYLGTLNLIKASKNLKRQPYFIYVSTACVFDGVNAPFSEDDIPNPKNFYSLTKLLSEVSVASSGLPKTLIIRTNFISKSPWPYKKAFIDRFGTYLFTDEVANGISDLIKNKKNGIVHLAGDEKISMYKLAKIVSPEVRPISLKNYKGPNLTIDMSLNTKNWNTYKTSALRSVRRVT